MAPLASDPRQVLIVLNLAKRKALYTLITEITDWMRSQLVLKQEPQDYGDAPLFVPADNDNDGPKAPQQQYAGPPNANLVRLRKDALTHFDAWRRELLSQLKELLSTPDDAKIVQERRSRTERIARNRTEVPAPGEDLLLDLGDSPSRGGTKVDGVVAARAERDRAVARLQASYHPIPTRLTTISQEDREETLSCILLHLLSGGKYLSESRTLAVYLASALKLPLSSLDAEEVEIAKSLVETSTSPEAARQREAMSAEAEALKRKEQNQASRFWKVGLASVAGAAVIGITGGLAAPVVAGAIGGIMGSVGLGGVASFLGVFWMNGALVGTLFGAMGARMTGEAVDQYAREVEDFKFIPLKDERKRRPRNDQECRRLRVTLGVNGWLDTEKDITGPWHNLNEDSEVFAVRYEVKSLMGLGRSLRELVSSYAWNTVKMEILKRTVLATLWSALWPAYLLSAASTIDNPFSLAKNRSEKAGEILADALINKVQGERPVTLIGYSLGARVIYSCLRSLAARRAFGLVDEVVFVGAPVPSDRHHWEAIRSVVSGKMYNVYSENDYLLAFMYRASSLQYGVAGLQEIKDIEGVENLNLSEEVQGHMRYPELIAKILALCGIPTVEGAAGSVEKEDVRTEEDEEKKFMIELDDLEKNGPPKGKGTGGQNLIDFDDAHPPAPVASPEPPPPPYSEKHNFLQRPSQKEKTAEEKQRPTVVRASSMGLADSMHDPLGEDPFSGLPLFTKPRPTPTPRQAVSAPSVPLARVSTSHSSRASALKASIPERPARVSTMPTRNAALFGDDVDNDTLGSKSATANSSSPAPTQSSPFLRMQQQQQVQNSHQQVLAVVSPSYPSLPSSSGPSSSQAIPSSETAQQQAHPPTLQRAATAKKADNSDYDSDGTDAGFKIKMLNNDSDDDHSDDDFAYVEPVPIDD